MAASAPRCSGNAPGGRHPRSMMRQCTIRHGQSFCHPRCELPSSRPTQSGRTADPRSKRHAPWRSTTPRRPEGDGLRKHWLSPNAERSPNRDTSDRVWRMSRIVWALQPGRMQPHSRSDSATHGRLHPVSQAAPPLGSSPCARREARGEVRPNTPVHRLYTKTAEGNGNESAPPPSCYTGCPSRSPRHRWRFPWRCPRTSHADRETDDLRRPSHRRNHHPPAAPALKPLAAQRLARPPRPRPCRRFALDTRQYTTQTSCWGEVPDRVTIECSLRFIKDTTNAEQAPSQAPAPLGSGLLGSVLRAARSLQRLRGELGEVRFGGPVYVRVLS